MKGSTPLASNGRRGCGGRMGNKGRRGNSFLYGMRTEMTKGTYYYYYYYYYYFFVFFFFEWHHPLVLVLYTRWEPPTYLTGTHSQTHVDQQDTEQKVRDNVQDSFSLHPRNISHGTFLLFRRAKEGGGRRDGNLSPPLIQSLLLYFPCHEVGCVYPPIYFVFVFVFASVAAVTFGRGVGNKTEPIRNEQMKMGSSPLAESGCVYDDCLFIYFFFFFVIPMCYMYKWFPSSNASPRRRTPLAPRPSEGTVCTFPIPSLDTTYYTHSLCSRYLFIYLFFAKNSNNNNTMQHICSIPFLSLSLFVLLFQSFPLPLPFSFVLSPSSCYYLYCLMLCLVEFVLDPVESSQRTGFHLSISSLFLDTFI
eukprot:gene13235-9081_t